MYDKVFVYEKDDSNVVSDVVEYPIDNRSWPLFYRCIKLQALSESKYISVTDPSVGDN